METITGIHKVLSFVVPTNLWFRPNATTWNEVAGNPRNFLSYMNWLTVLIGKKKQKRRKQQQKKRSGGPTSSISTETGEEMGGEGTDALDEEDEDVLIETHETAKTKPIYYLQRCKSRNSTIPYYVIHILLRGDGTEFQKAIEISIDDLNIKTNKETYQQRKDMTLERKRKTIDVGFSVTMPGQLKLILKGYISCLGPQHQKNIGLYDFMGNNSLIPHEIEKLVDYSTTMSLLTHFNVAEITEFQQFAKVRTGNKVQLDNQRGNFFKLSDIDFLSRGDRLPHLDERYFNLINLVFGLKDTPTIENQLSSVLSSGELSLEGIIDKHGGKRKYNDIFGLIRNFNGQQFQDIRVCHNECNTIFDLNAYYEPMYTKYIDEKLDLSMKLINQNAPEKVKSIYSESVAALLKWLYINRVKDGEVWIFQNKETENRFVKSSSMMIETLPCTPSTESNSTTTSPSSSSGRGDDGDDERSRLVSGGRLRRHGSEDEMDLVPNVVSGSSSTTTTTTTTPVYIPNPVRFRLFNPELSAISNFDLYMIECLNKLKYSAPGNNATFLCCFNGNLSQFSSDGGERHYVWLQGVPAASKSFILAELATLSIDETYGDMDDIGSQHSNTTQSRRSYARCYMDEGNKVFHSKDGKNGDELSKMKTMLSKNRLERTAMAFSDDKTERFTVQHQSEMLITIAASSNFTIYDEGLRDRFIIINVVPPTEKTLISELQIAKSLEDNINTSGEVQFRNFTKDLLACCAITNLAITQLAQFGINTIPSQVIGMVMAQHVYASFLPVNIEKRQLSRLIKSSGYQTIANSWLETMVLPGSIGHGKPFDKKYIIEAAKRQYTTLATTVLTFSQMFDSFRDQRVKVIGYSLFEKVFPLRKIIEEFYDVTFGLRYRFSGRLNYNTHLFALFDAGRVHDCALRKVSVGSDKNGDRRVFTDFNYVTITGKSDYDIARKLQTMIKDEYIESVEDILALIRNNKHMIKPKKVLKYIEEKDVFSSMSNITTNKRSAQEHIREYMRSKREYKKPYTVSQMDDAADKLLFSMENVLVGMQDGESYHEHAPSSVYKESIGLPMIKIESTQKDNARISFLIELFRLDPKRILIEAIESLSQFVTKPEKVLAVYGEETLTIEIKPREDKRSFMTNYRKMRRKTSGKDLYILEQMGNDVGRNLNIRGGIDDGEPSPSSEDNSRRGIDRSDLFESRSPSTTSSSAPIGFQPTTTRQSTTTNSFRSGSTTPFQPSTNSKSMYDEDSNFVVPTSEDDDKDQSLPFYPLITKPNPKSVVPLRESLRNPSQMGECILSHYHKKQIICEDTIDFSDMGIDEYFARLHLERYMVYGKEVDKYLPLHGREDY